MIVKIILTIKINKPLTTKISYEGTNYKFTNYPMNLKKNSVLDRSKHL